MNEIAVSDTGPLLHLTEIGQDSLLTLFPKVIIPPPVETELIRLGIREHITTVLANRLLVEAVDVAGLAIQQLAFAGFRVHLTDVNVAALAAQRSPDVVLTDDLELRKGLEAQGHQVVGSVGVLIRAFTAQRIAKPELYTLLDRLLDGSTLYLSREFYEHVQHLLHRLAP